MIPLQLAIVLTVLSNAGFKFIEFAFRVLFVYVAFGMPFAIFILTGFF